MTLSDDDRDALRHLRGVAENMMRLITDGMLVGGSFTTARRCWDAIAVLDRLTGANGGTDTPEARAVLAIRIGNQLGWAVHFDTDGTVVFVRNLEHEEIVVCLDLLTRELELPLQDLLREQLGPYDV